MAEQVKVYTNVNGVVPSAAIHSGATALNLNLVTTTSSQKAVIKDVVFAALGTGKNRVKPILELNGIAYKTGSGGALSCEGNIIVGPSSTLSITSATTASANPAGGFVGMFFTEGSSGIQKLTGNGSTTAMNPVKITGSSTPSDDAVAARPPTGAPGGGNGSDVYFYRIYNNVIYKYNSSGTLVTNWNGGGGGYSITTDGEYLYMGHNSHSTTINRSKLSDHSNSSLTTTSNYYGPQANQGAIFLHHDGKIYTRREGNQSLLDIIDLTTLAVTNKSSGDFSVGSYSDGGAIVTALDGTVYVVEAGPSYWYYYDIAGGGVTRGTGGGTSSSTEYAQGGGEIAPGIALIFGEQSDRATVIDMNTKAMTTDTGSHGYTTDYAYGDRFGFADFLETPSEFTYSCYAAGIEIT